MNSYIIIVALTLIIGMGATAYVNYNLKKYRSVRSSSGLTGAQAAQIMLQNHGVYGVKITRGQEGRDHFDPKTNSISLSPSVFDECSVTAYATACHEAGHACQFAQSYAPLRWRSALVPVVNIASNAWMFVFFMGFFINSLDIITLGVVIYAVVVLFQFVTLPVEFNASHRAMDYIKSIGTPKVEADGSFAVLRACALTYVAAALTSVLNLLYLLALRRD